MPAGRPTWRGHLKLSLVTCPVALYKAVEPAKRGVRFNLINPETGNRIQTRTHDPQSGTEVPRTELVKGYEVDRGLHVTITDEEIRGLKVESNGAFQIERFTPEAEIDRLYWDAPYYLVPEGELAFEAYGVIREAMREAGQVALARVVMNGRERQFALEVRGKGIVAHAIRTHAEVRPEAEYFAHLPDAAPQEAMVSIARQILKQHEGPFDPTAFVDRYQQAVLDLVERKRRAGEARSTGGRAVAEAEVVDLMEALKRSLGGPLPGPGRRREAKPKRDAAPKPGATKPASEPRTARRKAG